MKKESLSIENKALPVTRRFTAFFTNKWLIALLLLVIAAGCKKVTEVSGIVGVCPSGGHVKGVNSKLSGGVVAVFIYSRLPSN